MYRYDYLEIELNRYFTDGQYRDLTRDEAAQQLDGCDPPYDVDDALRIIQEAKAAEGTRRWLVKWDNQISLLGGGSHGNVAVFFGQLGEPCPSWFVRKYDRELAWYIKKHPEQDGIHEVSPTN